MGKCSDRRRKQMAAARMRRKADMRNNGGKSRYARKVAYCLAAQVDPLDIPEPKPWR